MAGRTIRVLLTSDEVDQEQMKITGVVVINLKSKKIQGGGRATLYSGTSVCMRTCTIKETLPSF